MYCSSSLRIIALFALCFVSTEAESHAGFLRHQAGDTTGNTVSAHQLEASLRASLGAVLSGGLAAERLAAIESSTWRTFHALPKNSFGRLDPRGVRHLVHSYFAKEHGWLINGLEPHGMTDNVSEVHHVNIMKDKAPALVESLLETRQHGRGLTFDDVVAMIGALEQLIFDESVELLQVAYDLNGQSPLDDLDEIALSEVLRSYLLVFGQGHQADIGNAQQHQDMKASLNWPELDEFQNNIVLNMKYARRHQTNPFKPPSYKFVDVARIVNQMAQNYGKWQNAECVAMKEALMDLDTDGTGRVPLSVFHAQPDGAVYQFLESREYLRQVGALDESVPGNPRVLTANYVNGPSNCIASSSYYSVCCLNECELLLNDIEGAVQAPTASVEHLLGVVANLSSATVSAPRELSASLTDKLRSIADVNGGMVPIQGRLFAQWLHYAFPHECPYPALVESSSVLTPTQWLGGKSLASSEEREQTSGSSLEVATADQEVFAQWSDDEVLPLYEPVVSSWSTAANWTRSGLRLAALLGALYLVSQAALTAVGTIQTALAGQGHGDAKKSGHFCNGADLMQSLHV